MLRNLRLMVLALLVLLVACGGQPPASPNSGSSTSQPPSTPSNTTFNIQFGGSVTATLTQAADRVDFFKNANSANGYTLSFIQGGGQLSAQITFYSENPPESGNYTFSLDVVSGAVTAAAFQQGQNLNLAFTLGQGQLTLEKSDEGYSGSFQFTSKGGQAGLQDQTITVNGTFAKLQIRT